MLPEIRLRIGIDQDVQVPLGRDLIIAAVASTLTTGWRP